MRIAVVGVDGVVGRGVAARLVSMGHEVVGLAPHRPISWPGSSHFVRADPRDIAAVRRTVAECDRVAHCGWTAGHAVVGAARTVFVVGATSDSVPGHCDDDWVILRCATVLGRDVDDAVLRRFTCPVVVESSARQLQVVHPEDVQRLVVRALLDANAPGGMVDLAAPGLTSVSDIAAAAGRPCIRIPLGRSARSRTADVDTTRAEWDFRPVWSAQDCVADFGLTARGRLSIGSRSGSLPWRLPRVRDVMAVDVPADDGVEPQAAGSPGSNGEFDTPIDPRFPAFVATNLSEALPGPFSPSSASVTVRGTRAAARVISERLRPGGMAQREMAVRLTGVFGHRLYAGITSAHFMAETVPFVASETIVEGFFGQNAKGIAIFGEQRPELPHTRLRMMMRGVMTFATNLIGLSAGSGIDTREYVSDIGGLESAAAKRDSLDDSQLRSLILSARDHVVQGWVLSSASIVVCAAYNVLLRVVCGRDLSPTPGPQVASAQSLTAVQRLAQQARLDPHAASVLAGHGLLIQELARRAPEFHRDLMSELHAIGHRGPAEVEMRSSVFADDPELLARLIARTLESTDRPTSQPADVPLRAKLIAHFGANQLRDREIRRDRMVRGIWILRELLRDYGLRLVDAGQLTLVDDVFYLLVDELDAPPASMRELVARRREEQRALSKLVPPEAFSGQWEPSSRETVMLRTGESLFGLGVCNGRAKGRVRVVTSGSIDAVQPGEVLVAKVTDVGYTAVFGYTAAVVTELGGPLSHAAIVAREFAVPCVVNARAATSRLRPGALVEVDGLTGKITVLDE